MHIAHARWECMVLAQLLDVYSHDVTVAAEAAVGFSRSCCTPAVPCTYRDSQARSAGGQVRQALCSIIATRQNASCAGRNVPQSRTAVAWDASFAVAMSLARAGTYKRSYSEATEKTDECSLCTEEDEGCHTHTAGLQRAYAERASQLLASACRRTRAQPVCTAASSCKDYHTERNGR